MKKHSFIFLSFISLVSCRDSVSDKTKLLGWDYELFQGTDIWKLAKATKDGDLEEMEILVKENKLNINLKDPKFGQPLIFLPIWHKQIAECEKLLELGADPNIHQTMDDETALIMAASETDPDNSIKLMRLLLKFGANVNDVQSDSTETRRDPTNLPINKTALIAACSDITAGKKPLSKVKLLIEAGANVNYTGNHNASPLKEALYHDNFDVALYLLEKGADYNQMLWNHGKYDENEPTYILSFLREQAYDFGTKEYEYKMKIVAFLKTKDLDYWSYPIHPRMVEEIKRVYPSNWEEYLKKY